MVNNTYLRRCIARRRGAHRVRACHSALLSILLMPYIYSHTLTYRKAHRAASRSTPSSRTPFGPPIYSADALYIFSHPTYRKVHRWRRGAHRVRARHSALLSILLIPNTYSHTLHTGRYIAWFRGAHRVRAHHSARRFWSAPPRNSVQCAAEKTFY